MENQAFLRQYSFLGGWGTGKNSAVSRAKGKYCLFTIPSLSVFNRLLLGCGFFYFSALFTLESICSCTNSIRFMVVVFSAGF